MVAFLLPIAFALLPFWFFPMGGYWVFVPLALALAGIPLLDMLFSPANSARAVGPKRFFDSVLYIYAICHVALIVWAGFLVGHRTQAWHEILGIVLSTGAITGGVGITFAHELVHRRNRFERLLGESILVLVCYGHFAVAHVFGHHRNVGTPADPATAVKGQSVYRFLLQAIPGVFVDAWNLRRRQTATYLCLSIAVAIAFGLAFGVIGVVLFLGQSSFAALLLETIDYVEHYGLRRIETSPGRYELVQPKHSWDSSARVSGYLLINLQRHADHHLHVVKEYPDLELMPEAPQLPFGYPAMFLIALCPPLWFAIMDKRVSG